MVSKCGAKGYPGSDGIREPGAGSHLRGGNTSGLRLFPDRPSNIKGGANRCGGLTSNRSRMYRSTIYMTPDPTFFLSKEVCMNQECRRYVGIDLAKRTMEVRVLHDGHPAIAWNQKTDQEGQRRLAKKLTPQDMVAFEACGAAFPLARYLIDHVGCEVVVLNPGALAMIWASTRKTDAEDAMKIAQFIQRHPTDELPLVALPGQQEEDRRAMVSELESKKGIRNQLINRLHTLYQRMGIVGLTCGDLKDSQSRDRNCASLEGHVKTQAQRINEELALIETHIDQIKSEISRELEEEPLTPILMSVPGVGTALAMAFLAHVGDGSRFTSGRQVSNYAGMTPRIDASGDTVRLGPITKHGCTVLRSIAVKAAWSAIHSKNAPLIKKKYEDIQSRRGKARAIVAIARHLLELMWAVSVHKEYYRTSTIQFRDAKLARLGLKCKSVGSAA